MPRRARRRTAADLPAAGTTYSRHVRRGDHRGGAITLPPKYRRAPCLYLHGPDGRYVLSAGGHSEGEWLCYRCLQWATVLDRWRQRMRQRTA